MAVGTGWIRPIVFFAAAVFGAGALGTGFAQASAQAVSVLQCQGTESDIYSPGVIFQARQFTVTTNRRFSACLDGAGKVASGSYGPEQFSLDVGCSDLFDGFHSVRTIRWSTGDA